MWQRTRSSRKSLQGVLAVFTHITLRSNHRQCQSAGILLMPVEHLTMARAPQCSGLMPRTNEFGHHKS